MKINTPKNLPLHPPPPSPLWRCTIGTTWYDHLSSTPRVQRWCSNGVNGSFGVWTQTDPQTSRWEFRFTLMFSSSSTLQLHSSLEPSFTKVHKHIDHMISENILRSFLHLRTFTTREWNIEYSEWFMWSRLSFIRVVYQSLFLILSSFTPMIPNTEQAVPSIPLSEHKWSTKFNQRLIMEVKVHLENVRYTIRDYDVTMFSFPPQKSPSHSPKGS